MIKWMLVLSLFFFGLAITILLYRIIWGPSIPDRVIALDTIGINIISGIAIISIVVDTKSFLEAILILGILAFISTVAVSKFIERGVVIELKRDR